MIFVELWEQTWLALNYLKSGIRDIKGNKMNKKRLLVIGSVIVVFVIAVVGASSINLAGSDSAPGEGKTVASCVEDLKITTPVDTSVHDANQIKVVTLTGDMSQCVGETLRAEVDLASGTHAWAVYQITEAITSLTLTFDATNGDFYDSKPTISAGDLQVTGNRVGPVLVKDFGMTTITIAKTWE